MGSYRRINGLPDGPDDSVGWWLMVAVALFLAGIIVVIIFESL